MKKILFLLLVLLGGMSSNVLTDDLSTFYRLKEIKDSVKNWETSPGTESEKLFAYVSKQPVKINDFVIEEWSVNWKIDQATWGFTVDKKEHYERWIVYNPEKNEFDTKNELILSETKGLAISVVFAIILLLLYIYLLRLVRVDSMLRQMYWLFSFVFAAATTMFHLYIGTIMLLLCMFIFVRMFIFVPSLDEN